MVFLPDPSWVIRIAFAALISEFLQMVWDGITYNMVSETGYGIWVWYGIVGWTTEQDYIHTYTLGATHTHKHTHTHTRMYVCIHVHRCMYAYIYILRSYITSFIIPTIPSLKGYIMVYVYIHTHVFIYVKSFAYIYIYTQIWMKCNNSPTRNELMSYWGVTRLPVLVSSWYFTHDQICGNFLF